MRSAVNLFTETAETISPVPLVCPVSSDSIMENGSSSEGKDPSAFLGEIIGAPVIVKLNSGVVYKGTTSLDLSRLTC